MESLKLIKKLKENKDIISSLKQEKWLKHLYLTEEKNVNYERINSMQEINSNYVLNYVEKTLEILEKEDIDITLKSIIEEVLIWSEVSKCGTSYQRNLWKQKGYNLLVHNIGSFEIYRDEASYVDKNKHIIVSMLIKTHGLIGQFLRGEVAAIELLPIQSLLNFVDRDMLIQLLYTLNKCIIESVSKELWHKLNGSVKKVIQNIIDNKLFDFSIEKRIQRLRSVSILQGEDIISQISQISKIQKVYDLHKMYNTIFLCKYFWYVEGALSSFNFEEFTKIFAMIYENVNILQLEHISFEKLMQQLYYNHKGEKKINIYKKRIIEKALKDLTFENIAEGKVINNEHLKVLFIRESANSISFNFEFSSACSKLIDFCVEAEKIGTLHEKAIVMLFDLFGFRRDEYDRFYNEEDYLNTMNSTINQKRIILDYIVGDKILDIGPGGGALMDSIIEKFPDKDVTGIDISTNVIEELTKKKVKENKLWNVQKGNVMELTNSIEKNSIDSIIFCSIIHELFSYIPYDGKKFNSETVEQALLNAYNVLKPGGRIIIRDGIKTEPENEERIIEFKDKNGMQFLKDYVNDFKGRKIKYTVITDNTVRMPINDAMEFLYTYTWGKESYAHEVQEQFGYYTPLKFKGTVSKLFHDNMKIIEFKHYLQDGYEQALSEKINFYDVSFKKVSLPDSTCLMVLEKVK